MRRVREPSPLPAVGTLVNLPEYVRLREAFPRELVVAAIREQLGSERNGDRLADDARAVLVEARLRQWTRPGLRRVINGTGVVLHTNLGRAPLSAPAVEAVMQVAGAYTNLELDLATGRRGSRGAVLDALLTRLTGAEAALVVNNNAAAVLLMLSALCKGREVIVSRGQQVEIGGSFRMPDVMRLSGARMVEVGTTNRTRASDYASAIGPRTAALLRVHTSNFRVSGFTEAASLDEMAEVAHRRDLLLLDDLGSGALTTVLDEPDVATSVRYADVVTFSGDKLFGGPQAGVAIGDPGLIQKMARHPLARAVRADKMTLAALEATVRQRLFGRASEIPVDRMLAMPVDEVRRRAAFWMVKLADREVPAKMMEGESAAGGGSLPGHGLPTVLLVLDGPASRLAAALRAGEPPVLARIEADACCIDPRTVMRGDDETLIDALEAAYKTVRR
jgi:L-seryl-tRNA(Ser) seleniumtransferase